MNISTTSRQDQEKGGDGSDWTVIFPLLFLLALLIPACADSGLDPETAHLVPGGDTDTITVPTLQKGLVKLGYTGRGGNLIAQDFVTFRNVTRYGVDTNGSGEVVSLRNVTMEASFVDPVHENARNPFAPVTRVVIGIPMLEVSGPSGAQIADLVADPLIATTDPGIRIEVNLDRKLIAYHPDRIDSTRGSGSATIASVDYIERRIVLSVRADLTDPTAAAAPQRIVFESLLELPF